MSLNSYSGKTFVAFVDISGFKKLMKNHDKAYDALDKFYQCGFEILEAQNNDIAIEGLFITDCGILFARMEEEEDNDNYIKCLESLLKVVKDINLKMISFDYMLTTSIAYGKFKYENRLEFSGVEKNLIFGNAYLSAYLDSEHAKPKIQPGQCRIVKNNLPNHIEQAIDNSQSGILNYIDNNRSDSDRFYFYWNVVDPNSIDQFIQDYKKLEEIKYKEMLKTIKQYLHS